MKCFTKIPFCLILENFVKIFQKIKKSDTILADYSA